MEKRKCGVVVFAALTVVCVIVFAVLFGAVIYEEPEVQQESVGGTTAVAGLIARDPKGCNGRRDLCSLRISEVTFPGSHNAGSGSDGPLMKSRGNITIELPTCSWTNQKLSITEQLEIGARFLDIDVCYVIEQDESVLPTGFYNCHEGNFGRGYGAPINETLDSIKKWVTQPGNSREVIMLKLGDFSDRFKQNTTVHSQFMDIVNDTFGSLLSTYFNTHNEIWPTLESLVNSTQTIVIFVEPDVCGSACRIIYTWAISTDVIADTYTRQLSLSNCNHIVDNAPEKCSHDVIAASRLLQLSGVGAAGMCLNDLQQRCDAVLEKATMTCFCKSKEAARTVNILAVDYLTSDSTVFAVSDQLNSLNVQMHGTQHLEIPELCS